MVWKEPGKDKDPWGDGDRGAPDLDKLVHELQRHFGSLFKRRRRRGQGRAYIWLIPLLLSAWLVSGFYVVEEGDRGVDVLLGQYRAVTQPGLHWHVPWPLGGRVIVTGVDSGDYVRGYGSLLTADGNAVTAEVDVQYRIVDLPAYLYANAVPGGGSAAADILGNLTDGAVSGAVAAAPESALLGRGVDGVANAARQRLTESMKGAATGLEVTQVTLRKVSVPAPVSSAYAGVRQAEQDAQKQKDDADAYAADVLPRARGDADSRIAAAKAYAAAVVERAHGDAAAFEGLLPAYRRAPAVTRESLTLSTFEEILTHVQRVIVVDKNSHVTLTLEKPVANPPAAAKTGNAAAPAKPPAQAKPAGGGPP
ncbi:MAG: FtsH protease activity modulator HflK [Bacillota bacterium]